VASSADLELSLNRRDAEGYAVELRFSRSDSETEVRLLPAGPALVQFDFEKLQALSLDTAEYGRALGSALFADPALQIGFAQARTSAEAVTAPLRLRLLIGPNPAGRETT
jgi:hypothetical protein